MVRLQKINVELSKKIILQNINLDLKNIHYSLLGKSGSGKTTLLNVINLLIKPKSGKVYSDIVGDIKSNNSIDIYRSYISTIFQNINLIPRFNVLENVLIGKINKFAPFSFTLPNSSYEKQKALICLQEVGLLSKSLESITNLSGGEKQRVAIARAIFKNPKLLIADEPVSNLDPQNTKIIMGILKKLCINKKICCIVSLHNPELAVKFSKNIIALKNGKVILNKNNGITKKDINKIYN